MTTEKLTIPLHDRSVVQVSRTDASATYLEVYGAGFAKDGHGIILRGAALLTDDDVNSLVALLTARQEGQAA